MSDLRSNHMTKQYEPHGVDDIWLRKLYDDCTTAQLMARVARVPIVVLDVTIDERIATPTHAFDHKRLRLNRRPVAAWN